MFIGGCANQKDVQSYIPFEAQGQEVVNAITMGCSRPFKLEQDCDSWQGANRLVEVKGLRMRVSSSKSGKLVLLMVNRKECNYGSSHCSTVSNNRNFELIKSLFIENEIKIRNVIPVVNDEVIAEDIVQDIKKAKSLLMDAGFNKNNPFTFEVVTNTGNEIRINAAQILQYQLQKVGVQMKIRVMEWQAFLNTVVHPRNFEAVLLGWNLALMPDAYPLWHSDSDKLGRFNLVGYRNKEVDDLIVKASTTINKEKLSLIYKKLFKLIANDNPYLFLYIPNSITAINNKIKNVEPTFIGVMHNQKDWIKP